MDENRDDPNWALVILFALLPVWVAAVVATWEQSVASAWLPMVTSVAVAPPACGFIFSVVRLLNRISEKRPPDAP